MTVHSTEAKCLTPEGSNDFWPASTLLCSSSCKSKIEMSTMARAGLAENKWVPGVAPLQLLQEFFQDIPGGEQGPNVEAAVPYTEQKLLVQWPLYQRLPQQACQPSETWL